MGFENSPYSPNVDTDIGDNGGSYYFRKDFSLKDVDNIEFGELYILSDNRAEIYVNGVLVDNDTINHNATYWNKPHTIFFDDFESYYDDGAHRIDGNDINRSPGFWYVDDSGQEVFMMCNINNYPAYSGTDVLVFRDMDAYGYAETTINLSERSDPILSYRWRMGPNDFESNEYGNVRVWDGSWHTVKTYHYGDIYHYAEINLSSYNLVQDFKVRFGSRSSWNNERFYVDDVTVKEKLIRINASYFVEGNNIIAVKLINNDSDSAKFDLKFDVKRKRYKSMLVMSDGKANVQCSQQGTGSATQDAIQAACDARDKGIVVYSVAFGGDADNVTLKKIACWNCSANDWLEGESEDNCHRYYQSNNADELKEIYRDIATEIANATYEAQIINVTGDIILNNTLYHDSYIEFNYTPIMPLGYGEVSLTFESMPFGGNITSPKNGTFYVFDENVIDAKVTSYSSQYWTDRLFVNTSRTGWNWQNVYNLSEYGDDYFKLGDPYIVQIPTNLISPGGNNSISIDTALDPQNTKGGSPNNRLIYSISTKGSVGYGDVFPNLQNATDDAIQRLKEMLEKFNITIIETEISSQDVGEIPSLWGPSKLEIRIWMQ